MACKGKSKQKGAKKGDKTQSKPKGEGKAKW